MKRARGLSWVAILSLAAGCGSSSSSTDGAVTNDGPADVVPASDTPAIAPGDGAPGVATPDGGDNAAPDGPAAGPDGSDVVLGPDGPVSVGGDGPTAIGRKLDLLFLVDNSPSMQEEQANLVRNFPALMTELQKVPGGLPDLHIGVVSSDLGAGSIPLQNGGCPRIGGDRGIFQVKPECGLAANAHFLVSAANGTQNNFQGDLPKVFGCMANLGTQGCGYEHQLQATRVALYESITPENKGFLRPDAMLAIVIITDEDDCSAEPNSTLFTDDASFPGTTASFRCAQVGHLCDGKQPPVAPFDADLASCTTNDDGRLVRVQEVVDSIKVLKPNPAQQIVVAGIFGWPANVVGARYRYAKEPDGLDYAPVCTSANGEATAALRLKKFVESFGAAGSFFSICNGDFSPAMQQIGARLAGRF